MRLIERWRNRVERAHERDRAHERATGVERNTEQAVSPADIERLEEQMVPWLREKRRKAREGQ